MAGPERRGARLDAVRGRVAAAATATTAAAVRVIAGEGLVVRFVRGCS